MLTHPTLDQLRAMKLWGMAKALEEQTQTPDIAELGFDERFGLLVDREAIERTNRRLKTRLGKAKLRQPACMEDVDYRHPRGLDKSLMAQLASCRWIGEHLNLLVVGPTGVGKTWLACALANQACREGHTTLYLRMPRLMNEMAMARGDGRYAKLLSVYAKTHLLVLDDWGLEPLSAQCRRDLLEILEDRYGLRSTLITSQLPVEKWHEYIGDPTLADAILDRLVHNAYRINLKGDSMRKKKAQLTKTKEEK